MVELEDLTDDRDLHPEVVATLPRAGRRADWFDQMTREVIERHARRRETMRNVRALFFIAGSSIGVLLSAMFPEQTVVIFSVLCVVLVEGYLVLDVAF